MQALQIISQSWPIAWMTFGAGAGFFIYLVVRRVTATSERAAELSLEREIQLERFKRGAIEHRQP